MDQQQNQQSEYVIQAYRYVGPVRLPLGQVSTDFINEFLRDSGYVLIRRDTPVESNFFTKNGMYTLPRGTFSLLVTMACILLAGLSLSALRGEDLISKTIGLLAFAGAMALIFQEIELTSKLQGFPTSTVRLLFIKNCRSLPEFLYRRWIYPRYELYVSNLPPVSEEDLNEEDFD